MKRIALFIGGSGIGLVEAADLLIESAAQSATDPGSVQLIVKIVVQSAIGLLTWYMQRRIEKYLKSKDESDSNNTKPR